MGRYILRRIWQMIPTVFGVIVITFILFNMVGGSPAMMTLGKNVSPKALEEFDEQRGFNKPLFFGRWTKTRSFADNYFERNASFWRDNPAVAWDQKDKYVFLSPVTNFSIPLAFNLKENTRYCWVIHYYLPRDDKAVTESASRDGHSRPGRESRVNITPDTLDSRLRGNDTADKQSKLMSVVPRSAYFRIESGSKEGIGLTRNLWLLKAGNKWQTAKIEFTTDKDPAELKFSLRSNSTPLKIGSIKLRRGTAHFFDSQFVFYLRQIARFDFGRSSYSNQRVSRMLRDGIRPSLFLTAPVFLIGLILAVSIALICAYFRDTWLDRTFVVIAVVLMSINYLVWIIIGQYFFAYRLGWFPIWGFESWRYLLLPVLIGVISGLGDNLRFYRTIMLDEMYRDYVRTAFAKGVSRSGVLFRHVLKNAMIPILTNVIIAVPFLYTGSLLLETFFGIPGLGNMGINAINYSDVDVVRAIVFIGAMLYVAANLLTDICYALVDPRVRLG